jgi:hypothetical protein
MLLVSIKAPSAVCIKDTASLALRTAWSRPLICEVIFEAMARPAASSCALLMRTPVDNLSMAVDMERSFATRAYRASNEDTFVLIVVMLFPLNFNLASLLVGELLVATHFTYLLPEEKEAILKAAGLFF